jgi:hypothetical protein
MLYTPSTTTYHLSDLVHVPDGTYLRLDRDGLLPISWAFGYQVAHTNTYVPASAYTARTPEGVRDIILNYPVHADGYLGVWTNQDGLTYVERTYWVEHLDPALALAQIWHQECIWDWANDEEVRLITR